ncbi:hypothetical protein NC652_008879 [Populus alba x Populus x berolinensis]|nr:hypothetical protein NC652_008879 [Populus alba x Populus x berolinensis]
MHEFIRMCFYGLSGANQPATLHEVEDNYLVKHFRDIVCGVRKKKKKGLDLCGNDLEDPRQQMWYLLARI